MKKLLLLMFLMPLFSLATYSSDIMQESIYVNSEGVIMKELVRVRLEFSDGNVLILLYHMDYNRNYDKVHYKLVSPNNALISSRYKEGDLEETRGKNVMQLFIEMFYRLEDVVRVDFG